MYVTYVEEDMVTLKTDNRRLIPVLCAVVAAFLFFSCTDVVNDPDTAVEKLVAAYGGPEKVELLQNYTGTGFMKDLVSTAIARSDPIDIYQKGELFKARITRLSMGRPTELMMTIYDGEELYQWIYGQGKKDIPLWELYINKYKFPNVLNWIQQPGVTGELHTDADNRNVYRLHYENEDDIIDLLLNSNTWLLREIRITSKSDSAFFYSEKYGDYRDVDGVPFPNRFTGTYRNRRYYEYMIPVIKYGVDLPNSIFGVTDEDTTAISKVMSAVKADTAK